jgi:hypothetical protein
LSLSPHNKNKNMLGENIHWIITSTLRRRLFSGSLVTPPPPQPHHPLKGVTDNSPNFGVGQFTLSL